MSSFQGDLERIIVMTTSHERMQGENKVSRQYSLVHFENFQAIRAGGADLMGYKLHA